MVDASVDLRLNFLGEDHNAEDLGFRASGFRVWGFRFRLLGSIWVSGSTSRPTHTGSLVTPS